MKLLIIEDNIQLVDSLKEHLENLFTIDAAYTGEDGLKKAKSKMHDIIMLDLGLPGKNGREVCEGIRQAGVSTPILILSGVHDTDKKVHLLDAGADDYMTKPFSAAELHARLQALMRRASSLVTNVMTFGELVVDLSRRTVMCAGQLVELRRKEFDILEYLLRNRDRILTREMISNHIIPAGKENWSNVVDVHIKRLRDKIERPLGKRFIETIHGVGYTIKS